MRGLSRADRELVEDSFRVLSLSLASLQGAESVPALIDSPLRESYQYRVYLQLADLYGKQERIKDAADTLAAFVRRQPLHAQAPLQLANPGLYPVLVELQSDLDRIWKAPPREGYAEDP